MLHNSPKKVLDHCIDSLLQAAIEPSHPFRLGVVGTMAHLKVNMRTVVLRGVAQQPLRLTFYTDGRSSKMNDIGHNQNTSWLFYDSVTRIQLRLWGTSVIHHQNDLTLLHWKKLSEFGRAAYRAMPGPSTAVDSSVSGLEYMELEGHVSSPDQGYENFVVISTLIHELDWLSLAEDGHRRLLFTNLDKDWKSQWLIP